MASKKNLINPTYKFNRKFSLYLLYTSSIAEAMPHTKAPDRDIMLRDFFCVLFKSRLIFNLSIFFLNNQFITFNRRS